MAIYHTNKYDKKSLVFRTDPANQTAIRTVERRVQCDGKP
jgi:hypothetical protein